MRAPAWTCPQRPGRRGRPPPPQPRRGSSARACRRRPAPRTPRLLLRQRPHLARRLPALLREHLDELPVVDPRMEQGVLVDDVENKQLRPEATCQPPGVLAG